MAKVETTSDATRNGAPARVAHDPPGAWPAHDCVDRTARPHMRSVRTRGGRELQTPRRGQPSTKLASVPSESNWREGAARGPKFTSFKHLDARLSSLEGVNKLCA
jgi:hypothetical protein